MTSSVSSFSDAPAAPTLALSVVVPCYNEAENLPLILPRLQKACESVTTDYEIIFVNDGSIDATWAAISRAARERKEIVGVNLARRYGQQTATSAGLSLCRGARILLIDADLQDPPELLPEMMRLMDDGVDVVYGQRRARNGESWFKKTSAIFFYKFLCAFGDESMPVNAGDFRLISRRVWETLMAMPERQRYLRGMIAWIGFRQEALVYDRAPRAKGKTGYSLRRMLDLAADALTSFSAAPLRFSFYLSLLCGLLALVFLAYVLLSWLAHDTVPGWTSLSCMMLFFFALQFFCIGIIGEYVGRIYLEGKQRPLFVIERVIGRAE